MSRLPTALLLAIAISGCDQLPANKPHGPTTAHAEVKLFRHPPPPGTYTKVSELVVASGTEERARERMRREAERQGCDAALVTDESIDSFDDPKEGKITRHVARGDCLRAVGAMPPPAAP